MNISLSSVIESFLNIFKYQTELPDFNFELLYSPTSDSNPLFFMVKISNNSKNDYSITKAKIIKRNPNSDNLLVSFSAKIRETSISSFEADHTNYEAKLKDVFTRSKVVDQLKIKAKANCYLIVYYQLDDKTYEYWKNFRRKKVIDGFITEDGKIIPTWFKSDEWELVLKDDRDIYWVSGGKNLNFPVMEEFLRNYNYLSQRLKEGNDIFSDLLKYKFHHFILKLQLTFKTTLFKLGIRKKI